MQILSKKYENYETAELAVSKLINEGTELVAGKIFKRTDMKFIFWGWGFIYGDGEGVFHEKVSNFLRELKRNYYYIIPLNFKCHIYKNKLPIIKMFLEDSNHTYKTVFDLDFSYEKFPINNFVQIPENLLFCENTTDWLILYNKEIDLGLFGYTSEFQKDSFLKQFYPYVLTKETVETELQFYYTSDQINLFKKNYFRK